MLILGIETSCDETAAAVVRDGREVLSNTVASQIEKHRLYGGVVPELASRCHTESISAVVSEALTSAGIKLSDLSGIAVTNTPGLIGALLVGVNFAKGLALSQNLPLIPAHHLKSHVASNYISGDLTPPFLCLIVSGGHSHIVLADTYVNYTVLSKTADDAAGECFDKTARAMGLPYPGGVFLDMEAEKGCECGILLPRPMVSSRPDDFSFSGLKTAVINIIHNAEQKGGSVNVPNLCYAIRETVVDILLEKLFYMAKKHNVTTVAAAGGVSANSLLRRRLKDEGEAMGFNVYLPNKCFCGDNGAMVAAQGYYELISGNTAGMELNAAAVMNL